MNDEKAKEIRFIDLFGGVGGFRLGLEGTGNPRTNQLRRHTEEADDRDSSVLAGRTRRFPTEFRCVWYNDIEKNAVAVYNERFGEEHEPRDIREVEANEVPEFDLLCAGFPCQPFSIAGKRQGFQDIRGTLFAEIVRVAEKKRPRLLLLENVKGLLSIDDGRCFATILTSLSELGYRLEWEVLNSKNFGVPQNRERVFIIGHLGEKCGSQVFPLGEGRQESYGMERATEERGQGMEDEVASGIGANYWKGRGGGRSIVVENDVSGLRNRSKWSDSLIIDVFNAQERKDGLAGTLKGEGTSETSIGTALATPESQSWRLRGTRSASGGSLRILDGMKIRRLTPLECERLQGFPDDWTRSGRLNGNEIAISDTSRYRQMGNAVTVNVIQAIGEKLLSSLQDYGVGDE